MKTWFKCIDILHKKRLQKFYRLFAMNWIGKLRFTSYKVLWRDNAWYGTSARESGFDKSLCWKPPLFPNVCPCLVNKFLAEERIDHQKNDQQRKSECHLQLSRTLGVHLNIYSTPDIPSLHPADSWQRWARIRTGSDWIRTEANFGWIRTGSDCNFFENWRIRTGSDWENFSCFDVIIMNISKFLSCR